MIVIFNVSPANQVNFKLLATGWGDSVSIISCWGIGDEDDNKKMWEVVTTI
jgi:hypothetical protein